MNSTNDPGDLRASIGLCLAFDKDPDRLIEFSLALAFLADPKFGAESDLEETVPDLVIGEVAPRGCSPIAMSAPRSRH
jgi:hypothetical protein